MKIRLNVCDIISAEWHKLYILSYKLALFGGSVMKMRDKVCGGI